MVPTRARLWGNRDATANHGMRQPRRFRSWRPLERRNSHQRKHLAHVSAVRGWWALKKFLWHDSNLHRVLRVMHCSPKRRATLKACSQGKYFPTGLALARSDAGVCVTAGILTPSRGRCSVKLAPTSHPSGEAAKHDIFGQTSPSAQEKLVRARDAVPGDVLRFLPKDSLLESQAQTKNQVSQRSVKAKPITFDIFILKIALYIAQPIMGGRDPIFAFS